MSLAMAGPAFRPHPCARCLPSGRAAGEVVTNAAPSTGRGDPAASTLILGAPAWALLAIAILVAGSAFDIRAIVLALGASGLVILLPIVPVAVDLDVRGRLEAFADRLAAHIGSSPTLLPSLAAAGIVGGTLFLGALSDAPARWATLGLLGLAALGVVTALPPRPTWIGGMILATIAGAALIARHTPSDNDVWYVVQGGVDQLLRGASPYTGCWPGDPDTSTACAFPYLPMSALALAPFRFLLGDIRFGLLAAAIVGSWTILELAPRRFGPSLALLPMPLLLLLVDRAWGEPILFAALAMLVLVVERRRPGIGIVALAVALATKQQVWILLPLTAWWPAFGPRRTAWAMVLAGGCIGTVAALAPGAFVDDAVWFLLALPSRTDSVSLAALLLRAGVEIPGVVVGLAVVLTEAAVILRAPGTTLGFVTGTAATLATLDLLNKQSFFNYHVLVLALLALGIALAIRVLVPELGEDRDPAVGQPVAARPSISASRWSRTRGHSSQITE